MYLKKQKICKSGYLSKMEKGFFSLANLLILVIIIGIMLAIVSVSFSEQRKERKLQAASRVIAGHLRAIQNNALTGRQIGLPSTDKVACEYAFIMNSNTSYDLKVRYRDEDENCSDTLSDSVYESYTVLENVNMISAPDITYTLPHGNVVNSGQIELRYPGLARSSYICVTDEGRIIEKGHDVTCP